MFKFRKNAKDKSGSREINASNNDASAGASAQSNDENFTVDAEGYRIPQMDPNKWNAEIANNATFDDDDQDDTAKSQNQPKFKFDIKSEGTEAKTEDLEQAAAVIKGMSLARSGTTTRRGRRGHSPSMSLNSEMSKETNGSLLSLNKDSREQQLAPSPSLQPNSINSVPDNKKQNDLANSKTLNPFGNLSQEFGGPTLMPISAQKSIQSVIAYTKQNLSIHFTAELMPLNSDQPQSSIAQLSIIFQNTSQSDKLQNVQFQVAVPKSLQLTILPPDDPIDCIEPGKKVERKAHIINPIGRSPEGKNAGFKLKLKVGFIGASGQVDEIVNFNGFPQWRWNQ